MTACFDRRIVLACLLLLVLGGSSALRAQEQNPADSSSPAEGTDKEGGEKPKKKKANVPMRKVLDHKKQFVIYPRFGYLKVLGADTVEPVDHASMGFDVQIGLKKKFYVSAQAQLLYISSGEYGITYSRRHDTIERYGAKNFTALYGVGIGAFTKFLDSQELWTHVGVNVGYLHPFYLPVWLGGDIEKEFRRTKGSYWVVTAAPMAGILIPLNEPVVTEDYAPVDPEAPPESGGPAIRFMLGAQLSVAFIFAPRG